MAHTRRRVTEGLSPACAFPQRLEDRANRARILRAERYRKPDKPEDFVCYDDSDSEDETMSLNKDSLNVSFNFVDFIRSREMLNKEVRRIRNDYGSRHILTHDMFRETPVSLGNMNKVFCSAWLSDRQVVFGTKCNKLMVYDVTTGTLDQIPLLRGRRVEGNQGNAGEQQCGVHCVELNPSRTLLATNARGSCDVAVYRLPTLDPVCVGVGAHRDWILGMCWLDDQFLVTGSRDVKMALWRVTPDLLEDKPDGALHCVQINAASIKECRSAQKEIRGVIHNKSFNEVAAISFNSYIHVWSVDSFRQKLSRKLPSCADTVCMSVHEKKELYAIGCRSYTLLLDARTLQAIKKVSARYSGCGIRSTSFQNDVLTVGTGLGMLMFYDVRAGKYLESSINSSRTVVLKASRGYVFPDEELMDGFQNVKYVPAIYTHCYDVSGTRLFTAGGPLPPNLIGNYAGLWQ